MTELKYSEVSSDMFTQAMQKLVRAPLNVRTAYQVKKWSDELNKARKQIVSEYTTELLEKYAAKDADGKVINGEHGPEIPESSREDFAKDQDAFGQKIVKVDRDKLYIQDLSSASGISAVELNALFPILSEEPSFAQIQQIHG